MNGERDGTRPKTGRGRIAPVAGGVLLSLTMVLVAVGALLFFGRGDFGRILWGLPGAPGLWALGFSMAGYPITRRHPANPVGWCLMVAGVAAGVMLLGFGLVVPEQFGASGPAVMLVRAWVFSVGALSSAVVLFPSGSPPSRWWWAQLGLLWVTGVLTYFADESGAGFIGLPEWLDPITVAAGIVFQLSIIAGFFSLLVRWRRSGALQRLQLKWVAYSVALLGTAGLVVELGIANLAPAWYLPGTVVVSILILAVPVAIGVAILRYRLYDIDVIVNRTLVYATVTLGLSYLGGVVVLQALLRAMTGQGSQLSIVASTLAIAAVFSPLRNRVQAFVDRLFYRSKYDAAKTLENFSSKLKNETDLDELSGDVVDLVRNTMQPEHVSLWLRDQVERASQETRS